MMKSKRAQLSRRAKIVELIQREPGITSAEIAEKLGLESTAKVSTALWPDVKRGRVMVERINRNGQTMNAHYLPDQVPPDAVERIQQKLVDAKSVIPIAKPDDARTSVFDNRPRKAKPRQSVGKRASVVRPTPIGDAVASMSSPVDFACAVTNDGSLVLMREGIIRFSLSCVEAATLQNYLIKRATANFFANGS